MTSILSWSYNTRYEIPKPDFPYATGGRLHVVSHIPPSPPRIRKECNLKFDGHRERRWIDPVERCLLHPPPAGSFAAGTAELEIVDFIRAGDECSAQLFTVRVLTSSSTPQELPSADEVLVAKLYDPLYYDHEQDDVDPFICVDSAYKNETAAYMTLEALQGLKIPRFFGSFSLSMPMNYRDIKGTREVRLILIEHIPGIQMMDIDPLDFSQSVRQTIMKTIVDIETSLYNRDVVGGDLHPRNIMVLNGYSHSDNSQTRPVVLVDLGKARTSRSPFPWFEHHSFPGVPITPLLRWIKRPVRFKDWIDWDWTPWIEMHYAHERSTITPAMQERWDPHA